jgi:hypothetical protein
MCKAFQLLSSLLIVCFGFAGIAQALPDMKSDDAVEWFGNNHSVNPLQPTQKYESGMSDFDSSNQVEDGSFHLTVFLNTQGNVETENIDYRPKCYPSTDCFGTVRFEKADRSSGHNLIEVVWGQEILDDFKASTLMETLANEGTRGTKRWYQGKLYNYETWHYTSYTIVHFGVVSKRSNQGERIREYTFCAKNPRSCGP